MNLSSRIEANLQIIHVSESRIDSALALAFKDAMRNATEDGPDIVILEPVSYTHLTLPTTPYV